MPLAINLKPPQTAPNLDHLVVNVADVPEAYQLKAPMHQREYLVGGQMLPWAGATADVYSPIYTHTPQGPKPTLIGSYPVSGKPEAMAALAAAQTAYNHGQGAWPTMGVAQRIACIENFVGRMLKKKTLVVNLLMWEIGKPLADAIKEFDRTVEYIYNTIDALKELDRQGSAFKIEQGIIGQIRRSPLGVVLCMGPYNYPLNETYTMLIPALLMGNVILFKPPRFGTLLHYPLLEDFKDCLPPGVLNTVYGRGHDVVPDLMATGAIDVLTLIGSSKVADQLKKAHPKSNRLRAVLGLDAKNVAIVTKNADIDLAVKECVLGALSFNGQRCTAIKMIYAHKSIADQFLQKMADAVAQLPCGLPWTDKVALTPLPDPAKPQYLTDCVADAVQHGAKIMNAGGGTVAHSFFYPAILYPVNRDMKLYHEEQFGPVVPVIAFDNVQEPIDYIFNSNHGQQAAIFSQDADELAQLIDPLVNHVSRLNINAQCQRGPDTFPFTGRKDSAEGTLSVADALRSFSIRTVVATKDTAANKKILNEIVQGDKSNFLSTKFIF